MSSEGGDTVWFGVKDTTGPLCAGEGVRQCLQGSAQAGEAGEWNKNRGPPEAGCVAQRGELG